MTGPGAAVGGAACVAVACLLLGAGGAAASDAGTDVPGASEEQKAKCRPTSRLTTSPPGRNSNETVLVSSLRLAAGWGAEDPLVEQVGGCPARFMLPPIANATAA